MNKKIKGLSLFANVGIGELLLKEVGVDIVVANELLKERANFYSLNHPTSKMIQGDITDPKIFKEVMDESIKNQVQFIIATPPCFVAGTKILTKNGYKNIEDITSSDRVLTHNNRFRKVVTPMSKITNELTELKIMGSPTIKTTKEHPFYVITKIEKYIKRKKVISYSEPYWKEAGELTKNDYVGINSNKDSKVFQIPENVSSKVKINSFLKKAKFWWILGRYVADGWYIEEKNGSRNDFIICCNKNETDFLKKKIEEFFHANIIHEETTDKVYVSSKELVDLAKEFQKGCEEKVIPNWVVELPLEYLQEFWQGYATGDGSKKGNRYKLTSIDFNLMLSTGRIINKIYKKQPYIGLNEVPNTKIIQGRLVNHKNFYSLECSEKGVSHTIVLHDKLWAPVRKVNHIKSLNTKVYNIEVEEDNSYTVNNFIVHNCQGMSMAGKMAENDPRNLLILKVIEAVKLIKPQYTLIENVPQMLKSYISVKSQKKLIIDHLKEQLSKDYNITFKVVDAADYETPQYRKRAIIVLVKKDRGSYEFPKLFKHISVEETIGHLPSLESGEKSIIKYHESKTHNERHIEWMKHTPTGESAHHNKVHYPKKDGRKIKGFLTTYKRIRWDKPAPTITMANGSVSSQNNVHPGRLKNDGTYSDARVLTIKELMLLSGIPDTWVIPSGISDNVVRHVIGEQVPPKMMYHIVKALLK